MPLGPIIIWLFGPVGRYFALAGLASLAAYFLFTYIEDRGADRALTKVETNDKKAGDKADASANTVDRCFNAGGVWIIGTGKCDFTKRP